MFSNRTKPALLAVALAAFFLFMAVYVHSETIQHPYIGAVLGRGEAGWRVIRVDPSGKAALGHVQQGDRMVSVDGIAAEAKYAGQTQTSLTNVSTATLLHRDGSVYEFRVHASNADVWKSLFAMLLEALLLSISWLAYRANPGSSTVRKFSLMNYVMALVILAVYSTEMTVSNWILALSSLWLPYLLLSFCVSFVLRAVPRTWARALTAFRVLSLLLACCALWAVAQPEIPGWIRGILHLVLLLVLLLLLATVALYWGSLDRVEKNHALVLVAGLVTSLLPFLLLYALPNIWGDRYVIAPEYALIGLVPLSVIFLYILNKRSILDMQLYLPRLFIHTVYYVSVFVLLALAYRVRYPYGVSGLFICFVVGTWAYRNLVQRSKRHAEGRKKWLERQTYKLSIQAVSKRNIQDILSMMGEMLHHIVDVEGMFIIWQEEQDKQPIFHGTVKYGDMVEVNPITGQDNRLLDRSHWVQNYDFEHVVSLTSGDENAGEGYLCVGPKRNQSMFSAEEKQLIEDVGNESVRLLVNARLMSGIYKEFQHSKEQNAAYKRDVSGIRAANYLLLEAQQAERIRLSYRLHDHLLQNLIFLSRDLEELADQGTVNARRMASWLKCLNTSQQEIRLLCDELYPHIVDKADLEASLHWLLRTVKEQSGLSVSLDYRWNAETPPDTILKSNLFRIIRELVLNVQKHAEASQLHIRFIHIPAEGICCTVSDNGKGFDATAFSEQSSFMSGSHLGLISVSSQIGHLGGELDIQSRPGKGTVITIRLRPQHYDSQEVQQYG
ncbi:sensor histidine kinase [Paenibacillus jilunlii]|uniref:histidine kinase n=1 Tax=Paenibacillus jilunlii TaxID=682956 RepID=A0A1G9NGG5_9BACL|nr:ATP-binding protein [Paenibacillus jilunlii]KWX79047.1 hypothetical protein AML91_03795 [Paenibacillus jilunlii]SDL85642.1 two-component system, NarL family, sensor histidine kinase ComP [Paenibacillus jilunlii]